MKEVMKLPAGWLWTHLNEISEIILGQSPTSSTYNETGNGLPFYQGKLEFGNIYPIPQKWCSGPKKIAEKGDVLISVRAPVGPTNICPEKSCIGRGLAAIRPLGGIETLFTLYLMRAFENSIAEKGTGTTFDAITGIQLKEFGIPLPPLPEQRAIVSKIEQLFSDLDNGIENFRKAQAQLKLYRQSVLKAACEGKLVPTEAELARAEGRDYEAGDVLLARILKERREKWNGKGKYKEAAAPDISGLPELPEGWGWANVGMISEKIQYGTSEKAGEDNSGIPVLRMGNIQDGKLIFDNLKYFPKEWPELSDFLLEDGDVLFNRTNSAELVGKTSVYKNRQTPTVFASYLIRVIVIKSAYTPDLLSFFINSIFGRKYIGSVVSQQVGQANVNGTKLSKMPIPFPPHSEQRRIIAEVERRLSVSDKMEATIAESLQKAESLRQSILKKAFEGKLLNKKELGIARNAPDWEPAEKLLERINAEKVKAQKNKHMSGE